MYLIETERTGVRHFLESDFDDLHEIFSNPLVMENTEAPYDKDKTRAFLNGFCIKMKRALAVVHKEDDKVIGYLLFSDSLEEDVYELG